MTDEKDTHPADRQSIWDEMLGRFLIYGSDAPRPKAEDYPDDPKGFLTASIVHAMISRVYPVPQHTGILGTSVIDGVRNMGIVGTATRDPVPEHERWIGGTNPRVYILEDGIETAYVGLDLAVGPDIAGIFTAGETSVYVGGELIGETDSLSETPDPWEYGWPDRKGDAVVIEGSARFRGEVMLSIALREPPAPFHYSDLNQAPRNARRGRKRRRKCK